MRCPPCIAKESKESPLNTQIRGPPELPGMHFILCHLVPLGFPRTHSEAPKHCVGAPTSAPYKRTFRVSGFPAGATLVAYCVPPKPQARAGGRRAKARRMTDRDVAREEGIRGHPRQARGTRKGDGGRAVVPSSRRAQGVSRDPGRPRASPSVPRSKVGEGKRPSRFLGGAQRGSFAFCLTAGRPDCHPLLPSLRVSQPGLRLGFDPLRPLRRPLVSPAAHRAGLLGLALRRGPDLAVGLPPARSRATAVALSLEEQSVPFGGLWPPLSTDAQDATRLRGVGRPTEWNMPATKGKCGGKSVSGMASHWRPFSTYRYYKGKKL